MSTTLQTTLSYAEYRSLEFVAVSPKEWAETAIKERARVAGDEIIKIAVDKFLELGETIPGNRDEIISAAFSRGWVKTAAQRHADSLAEEAAQ